MEAPPTLFDSHAHLTFPRLCRDLEAVLERARSVGVRRIVTIGVGEGVEGAAAAVALAESDPRVHAAVGVHPHDADLGISWSGAPEAPVAADVRAAWDAALEAAMERLRALSCHERVVAIGEAGLDFHYDRSPRELQRELFRRSVRLAVERGLPLVIHAREAEEEAGAILVDEDAALVGGVIHCFSGHQGLAEVGLRLGFSFGVTGILTFPGAEALRRAAGRLPLDRLLIETDCPYLAPVPHRGKRNEPAFVIEVARRLAEVRGLSLEEVAAATCANAERLFGIE